MTILRYLLFVPVLTCFFSAPAQERFIDIPVSDTVVLKTTGITYVISSGDQIEFMGMRIPQGNMQETSGQYSVSEITALLEKDKYRYTLSTDHTFTISASETKPQIIVTLRNEQELQKLVRMLRSQRGISGRISELTHEPITRHHESLYKRAYARAHLQASLIAAAAGGTVGKVISVTQPSGGGSDAMDMYKQILKNASMAASDDASVSGKKEVVQLVFRFELK
jgi:hypothetical protein